VNCKPGDLAVIVAHSPNYGRFVSVVRRYAGEDIEGQDYYMKPGVVYWVVEANGAPLFVRQDFGPALWCAQHVVRDERLRPIRPGDISDEEVRDLYAPKVPEVA
jgi:hypothetical protein